MIQTADKVREAISHEPAIRPNFERASISHIIVVMFAAMMKGMTTASSIYRYLDDRGCRFDRDTIDFLLNAYEGDDAERHLWSRMPAGDYMPLLEALPY